MHLAPEQVLTQPGVEHERLASDGMARSWDGSVVVRGRESVHTNTAIWERAADREPAIGGPTFCSALDRGQDVLSRKPVRVGILVSVFLPQVLSQPADA